MPSLQNTNAGPQSNLSWRAASRRVARSVGGMNDPNIVAAANDAISEALQDWNTEKDWRFLQIIAPDIAVTAATSRYALPTNYKKAYDAYLVSSQLKLDYVEIRLHDMMLPAAPLISSTSAYTLYNVGTTGEIQLLPNSTNDTLVVRYYRPIKESGVDDETLDLPSRYVPGVLAKARAFMCLDAKDYSGFDRWMALATNRLTWAKRDDDRIPDEELRFRPAIFSGNLVHTADMEIM